MIERQDAPLHENQLAASHLITDHFPKCWRCRRTLCGYATRPWAIRCQRCNADNGSEPEAGPRFQT